MGLNWAQWTLLWLYAFSTIWAVASIGKEREPRSAGEAALGLIITAGMMFLVIKAGS